MQGDSLHRIKMTAFVVIALALVGISFHGVLDDFALASVVKTTNQSILILAITGAIDAAISLLQSMQLGAFLGLEVGQLLDPINDAIERLLSVMVWAVGSLTLQRIIIEIASSWAFKWGFFWLGIMATASWLLGSWQRFRDLFGAWEGCSALFTRLFIYMAILRFIVPLFAIISLLVGSLLFDAEINQSKEELSLFSEGIALDTSAPVPGTPEFEEQRIRKVSELEELRERKTTHENEAQALDARIDELDAGGGLRQYLPESLGGTSPRQRQVFQPTGIPELDGLMRRMATYDQEAQALDARIDELDAGGGLRQYLPESLGGTSPGQRQVFEPTGVPELDELVQRMATYEEEVETLDARIEELDAGGGLRQYLPESLGGTSPEEWQVFEPTGIPELDELLERMAAFDEEAQALDARIDELDAGGGLRQYLPESLGGTSPGEWQVFEPTGIPELDELLERMAAYDEEAQALDARIGELDAGGGLRQYLPESLGGTSPGERQVFEPTGIPELDELLRRMAAYDEEAQALDARIDELGVGGGLRQYLPESLGGTSPGERQVHEAAGIPELDELLRRMAAYAEEAEALDARIDELSAEGGLRQYLPESLGGISPDEQLGSAKARREEIGRKMEAVEKQVRTIESEQITPLKARREEIRREMEALGNQVRTIETEQITSVKARREEIRREMEALGNQVRTIETEQITSVKARREEIRREMEALGNQVRAIEREQIASVKARREQVSGEMEALGNQVRVIDREQIASAKAKREEVRSEVEALGKQVRAIEREQIASVKARREQVSGEMETVDSQTQAVEEELECIEKRTAGEDCVSLLGNLLAMAQGGYAHIKHLVGNPGEVITTTVRLIIFILVKNILLPIGFLMIAVKCALPLARYCARMTSDFRRDVRELAAAVSPGTGSPRLNERSEGA